MIHVIVRERDATAQATEPITSGSVGLACTFRFSEDWDGLGKVAIFQGSGQIVDVALLGQESCAVPQEVLQSALGHLKIGVYGTGDQGQRVTPTIWADAGQILPGAEPSQIEPTPATQSLVQQILEAAEDAAEIAQSVRDDADAGEFDGEPGPKGETGPAGTSIWRVDASHVTGHYAIATRYLEGREGTAPAVDDLVIASDWNVYVLRFVSASSVGGDLLGNIKGETGAAGATGDRGTDGDDGSVIWTSSALVEAASSSDWRILTSSLSGPLDKTPKSGDLLIGPPPGTSGTPTCLYSIYLIGSSGYSYLYAVGSIKGDSGEVSQAEFDALTGEVGGLKSAIGEINSNVVFEKNLIETAVEGYVVASTSAGSSFAVSSNSGYGYAVVPVEGGKPYSINNGNYSNSFSVVVGSGDVVIDKLRAYADSTIPTVYNMPANAEYIVLCGSQFSSSGTKNVVVLQRNESIADTSIYNTVNYPFNVVKKVEIAKLYDSRSGKFADELFASIPSAPFINSFYTQYVDKTKWESGCYWTKSGTSVVKTSTQNTYYAYPPFEVPAGSYRSLTYSSNFSFVKYDNGTIKKFSEIAVNIGEYGDRITLERDATVYLSSTNTTYTMFSDGEYPVGDSGVLFVSGKYNLSTNQVFYCGHTRPLNTLRKAIETATQFFDSIVYVDAETFDLAEEFADELPLYDGSNVKEGIVLKNRVHVIFASGARVSFDYSGSNEYVYTCFSPFNAGMYGFTLENAWVESKNCRYAVHDEMNSERIPYKNEYKHCTFIHDSSESSWGVHQALGGGLGLHGDIVMDGCFCSSEGAVEGNMPIESYHNATSQTYESKSNILIKNCYFEGTFRCTNHGISTEKSRVTVTNCSLLSEPYYEKTVTAQRADNMVLYKWNNEIRES